MKHGYVVSSTQSSARSKACSSACTVLFRLTNPFSQTGSHRHVNGNSLEERNTATVSAPRPAPPNNKRLHDDDPDSSGDEGSHHPPRKLTKIAEFPENYQPALIYSCSRYRVLLTVHNAFPDHSQEAGFARRAWQDANMETGQNLPLTPSIMKLVLHITFLSVGPPRSDAHTLDNEALLSPSRRAQNQGPAAYRNIVWLRQRQ